MAVKRGTLESQIRIVLAQDKQSRNSDIRLMQVLWIKFYPHYVRNFEGSWFVEFGNMYFLPREDNIKRIRAKIQNKRHEFVPTDVDVALKRGFTNVDEWRKYLGYSYGDPL